MSLEAYNPDAPGLEESTAGNRDENDEEEEDEEVFSRGRSRSRSMHANDDGVKATDLIPALDDSNSDGVQSSTPSTTVNKPVERTGPLQHREVVALKKGLEEQCHLRNKEQVREEEEEKRAAAMEKQTRQHSISTASASMTAMGTDLPMRRVKILMLGDSGVGKSSLITRWTLDTFNPTLVSTVGVDFKAKKVCLDDDEVLNVQVWDTAGQEHFHKITQSYYKGANGIMLVFDVSDRATLDNVEYWIKNIKKHALDSVHVALVGNKTDLRTHCYNSNNTMLQQRCCDTAVGRNVAQKFGVPYFETSAKESSNVDDAYLTVLRSIVAGEGFANSAPSSSGAGGHGGHPGSAGKPRSTIMQKLEHNKSQSGINSIFSSLGRKDRDKSADSSAGGGAAGGSNSGSSAGGGSGDAKEARMKDDKEKCKVS